MDQFYNQQHSGQDVQQQQQQQQQQQPQNQASADMDAMSGIDFGGMGDSNHYDAQSAGNNNTSAQEENRATERRQSQGQGQASGLQNQGMMGFNGSGQGGSLENYQFNPSSSDQNVMMNNAAMFATGMGMNMSNLQMMQSMNMPQFNGQTPQFTSPMYQMPQANMNMPVSFPQQNWPMTLNYNDPQTLAAIMMAFSMMPQAQFPPGMMSGMMYNYSNNHNNQNSHNNNNNNSMSQDSGRPGGFEQRSNTNNRQDQGEDMQTGKQSGQVQASSGHPNFGGSNMQMQPSSGGQFQSSNRDQDSSLAQMQANAGQQMQEAQPNPVYMQNSQPQLNLRYSSTSITPGKNNGHSSDNSMAAWTKPALGLSTSVPPNNGNPNPQEFKNAYSSTGFDMLTVLMRVATRSNPEINIGAVDLSCAFVVCDASEHDIPIVYCSENFERLTGYTKHEILGRNCRFLQAPDGRVKAGIKRDYVDDESVLYLKNMVSARREAQVSLINYRKGGQPFMNLLTMIPIPYETDEIRFIVGFQVDLVEQPNSVTSKNPDGSYTINYQRGLTMPRYVVKTPEFYNSTESGQTISRDDVSTVLSTIGTGESDLSKRIWDKVLLENADDVIFVLSLKGLFLYLSPSSKKLLEYEAHELVGTPLSSVCHPSDIVPVTRELKDTSPSSSVNVVFRVRRKTSGYMWFEGQGSLHAEQGKGRKSIMLVGRERPVYALSRASLLSSEGIGENEIWTKLSTSGMFLFVSSNVRTLLDKTPEELVGTSIQSLMRSESKTDFQRILEVARSGRKASAKHELLHKRGQVLQAFSIIYPGDATEGQKPTFIIAQSRLLKYARPSAASAQKPQPAPKLDREMSGSSMANSIVSTTSRRQTSQSMGSPSKYMSTFEAAITHAGQDGLMIGHQDEALAAESNIFEEFKTTRSTSWQFELRQMEKRNRLLAEELQVLLASKKKRKRRKGSGLVEKDCANCHTRTTPEWRRGPSGNRDLCNSCGLRWAKQQGRISPRTSSQRSAHSGNSDRGNTSPQQKIVEAALVANKDAVGSTLAAAASISVKTVNSPHPGSERQQQQRQPQPQSLSLSQSQSQSQSESQSQSPTRGFNTMPTHIEEEDDEQQEDEDV